MAHLALTWPEPDPVLEAGTDSPARRAQRANRAAQAVVQDRHRLERAAAQRLIRRLTILQNSLRQRLLAGQGSLTDFRRFTLQTLAGDVDRLVAQATADLATGAEQDYRQATELATEHATEPLKAAQLTVGIGHQLPGLDAQLVTSAFDNTVDLLTPPMQQFGSDVKVALRRVALAGENRFEELGRLRDRIAGQGFSNAQYRAERIIRTELGRTFNDATFQRLTGLARDFPFLRKGWRATKDSRTRHGHVEAGQQYSRGNGIPITATFQVKVYQQTPKGPGKLMGIVSLRFPIDPNASPAGKLAAAATIMCRCNGFVDFDLADFAQFTKQAVQVAVGGPPAVPAVPGARPPAVPKAPRRRTKAPKAPKAAAPVPRTVPRGAQAAGTPVSAALKVPLGRGPAGHTYDERGSRIPGTKGGAYDNARKAMKVIDSVHGDGILADLPFTMSSRETAYGYYWPNRGVGGKELALTRIGAASHPLMTVIHESAHWLDDMAIGKGPGNRPLMVTGRRIVRVPGAKRGKRFQWVEDTHLAKQPAAPAGYTRVGHMSTLDPNNTMPELQELKRRLDASPEVQAMKKWAADYRQRPIGIQAGELDNLTGIHEQFARGYAQWVTTRSGDAAALAELRDLQGRIAPLTIGSQDRLSPTFTEPRQWSDANFAPIAEAFDALFQALGWIR